MVGNENSGRPGGNPDIATIGADQQFGKAVDAAEAAMRGKPWSIRNAMKYWSLQGYDLMDPAQFEKLVEERRHTMTAGQYIALVQVRKAMQGIDTCVERVTESIEGKLPQTNLNAELDLNDTESATELADARAKLTRRLVQSFDTGTAGGGDGAADAPPDKETSV